MSLLDILGSVAPTIASALPGPLGGIAKGIVTGLLGLKPNASQDEIEKTLATSNPEMLVKLHQADLDFQAKMKEMDVDLDKLAAADTSDARQMQVSTRAKTPAILATIVVGAWCGVMGLLLFHGIPVANTPLIMRALGLLDGALMLVLGFYFGSSFGSLRKTEIMAQNQKGGD